MSACEVTTLEGFVSKKNLMRMEFPDVTLEGFRLDQYVINTENGRKAKLHRFCYADGVYQADIRYWRDRTDSPNRNLLKMVELSTLKPIERPTNELQYLWKLHTLPRNGL
jgi:hypothetical protein